jgi:hypothetical protein
VTLFARLRQKYAERCPAALDMYDTLEEAGPMPDYIDADRASGLAECGECGHQLYDHPPHPFAESLTITCNGEFLKL